MLRLRKRKSVGGKSVSSSTSTGILCRDRGDEHCNDIITAKADEEEEPPAPPAIPLRQLDTNSLESSSLSGGRCCGSSREGEEEGREDDGVLELARRKWAEPYEPPPIVPQSTILLFGFFIFLLGQIWPPLILLVTYVASKLVPYSFRANDDASARRQLFREFSRDNDDLPDNFKQIPADIQLEEGFWVNQRYV